MLKHGLILICVGLGACSPQIAGPFGDEQRVRAEEVSRDADMIASAEQILDWHRSNQTGLSAELNPGADRAAILREFADLPCRPTEELVQLWAWHNGSREATIPFIWYHNFLSVEAARSEYEGLVRNPLMGWHRNWMPIFEFEGEWYFTECYEETRQAGPVGYYFLEDTEAYYVYLNLTRLLETSAAWFDQSAVTWDPEQRGMEEDIKKVFEIHQMFNEGARFPYLVE